MRRALRLAARGTKAVRPNPPVGCVLVRDGAVVGEGFHARVGGPHAEVVALAQAGGAARGATAYVTLEPCAHQGRTPPCSRALIEAGVRRVVIGQRDPHPIAAGGADALREAGIEVRLDVCATAAADACAVFLTNVRDRRPWLQLKLAATLDGRAAALDGSTRWITGDAARRAVHKMRNAADAVLIGSGTALADDPVLDVRNVRPAGPPPVRVVLDRRGRLHAGLQLGDTARQATWVVQDDRSPAGGGAPIGSRAGVEVIAVALPAAAVSSWLAAVLAALYARGICHVLCEGGPTLAASLLRADLVDRLDWFVAPKLLGSGTPALGDLGIGTLADALPLRLRSVARKGGDVQLVYRRHLDRTAPPQRS
ncbi:MAG: bifunctional diaminohydroxyphosphoribosylaminopyrimidine deaminase/5-amino-6-(5-phosphoribosylamino)uracil reductase RibD [Myxococcales bacterium]|nr:bifunctional diaminohydroxyphosphoribosylaminopyrimidine deaminase/5-amino-6-(5-phosphoribosylamino)uracil reductase RibD [Myxococcales bacterium]